MTTPSMRQIGHAVARAHGWTLADLVGENRQPALAWARQVAMYLAYTMTGASLAQVGRAYHRDHTTVSHAVRRVETSVACDEAVSRRIDRIATEIRAEAGQVDRVRRDDAIDAIVDELTAEFRCRLTDAIARIRGDEAGHG